MTDHQCEQCHRGKLQRSERRGLWERYFLSMAGRYPWRCNFCRVRVILADRGPGRQYVRRHRSSPTG